MSEQNLVEILNQQQARTPNEVSQPTASHEVARSRSRRPKTSYEKSKFTFSGTQTTNLSNGQEPGQELDTAKEQPGFIASFSEAQSIENAVREVPPTAENVLATMPLSL